MEITVCPAFLKATEQEQEWDRNGKKDCPAFWRRQSESRNGARMEIKVVQLFEGDRVRAGMEQEWARMGMEQEWK